MKLAIASGKGGTGKSSIATQLAFLLAEKGLPITLLDCDVEEPNCHLFFKRGATSESLATTKIPRIDPAKCIGCQKCASVCRYKALCVLGKSKPFDVMVFHELCHSCGACLLACPAGAMSEADRVIGKMVTSAVPMSAHFHLSLVYGLLNVGEAKAPPLIRQVRQKNYPKSHQIIDAPPGTSCAPMSAVEDVDFALMVAEPTRFGANDLTLALEMIQALGVPHGIVISKSGTSDHFIEAIAKEKKVEIIARIPEDRAIAECYSTGALAVQLLPVLRQYYVPIIQLIERLIENE